MARSHPERGARGADHGARHYYESGKSFLYRLLPFWVASLADRIAILLVPIVLLMLPGLRVLPLLYSWRYARASTAGTASPSRSSAALSRSSRRRIAARCSRDWTKSRER